MMMEKDSLAPVANTFINGTSVFYTSGMRKAIGDDNLLIVLGYEILRLHFKHWTPTIDDSIQIRESI